MKPSYDGFIDQPTGVGLILPTYGCRIIDAKVKIFLYVTKLLYYNILHLFYAIKQMFNILWLSMLRMIPKWRRHLRMG